VSVDVRVAAVGVRAPIASARVTALAEAVLRAERVRAAELSFTFVTRRAIAALNRRHLGHRGATDIITFELAPAPGGPLGGDVYVSPDVAREHAARFGRPVREEVARLVVHGTLHAIGYTHPEDDAREGSAMWARQERYLARFWTPASRAAA